MAGADALPLPAGAPAGLSMASNALAQAADRARQTRIHQEGGRSPVISDSWQGEAKEARVAEANRLRGRVAGAVDRLPVIGQALRTYEDTLSPTIENVRTWQRLWDEAEESYRAQLRQLNDQPFPEEDRQPIADGYADDRDAEHRRLLGRYLRAMEDLRAAGTRAATTVRGQCDMVVPADRAGSRLEIGAHILDGLPLSGGEAMSELAAELGPELAEQLRSALSSEDPEVLAALLTQYGQYADDPYFAHAVMVELRVDGLMGAFEDLAIANIGYGGSEELAAQQQEVMGLLGTLYATASGPADGDIEPDGYNYDAITAWREHVWFDALTTAGNAQHPLEADGFAGGWYDGYWAQAQLLTAGAARGTVPGRSYMEVVGADMVAWDRAHGMADDQRDWNFAAPTHQPSLIKDDGSAFAGLVQDPLYALLHAAAQDEDASHGLLLSSWPVGEDGEQSVLRYLVHERGGTMADAQPFADQGELLAQAVAEYGTDRTDEDSTELAGHYLNAYADTIGYGAYGNGAEVSEHAFVSGRTATADVIATHIEDFLRVTGALTGDSTSAVSSDSPDGHSVVHFDTDTRNGFARTFGFLALDRPQDVAFYDGENSHGDPNNPPALQRIINAAAEHTSMSLRDGLATHDGDWSNYPPEAAITAAGRGAGFLTYVGESAGLGLKGEAEVEQAYNEYLKSMFSRGAGLVPVPGGKLADLAYSTATDAILNQVNDTGPVVRAEAAGADLNTQVHQLLDDLITGAVIENDSWPEGQDPLTFANNWADLSPEDSFVENGALRPMADILSDDEWSANFFTHYLDRDDGGGPALREFYDQSEDALAVGKTAHDHWKLGEEQ